MELRLRSVPALCGTVLAAIATLIATMLVVDAWGVPVAGMLLTVALGILALHAVQRERRATVDAIGERDARAELRAAELRHRLLADNATDTILAFGADGAHHVRLARLQRADRPRARRRSSGASRATSSIPTIAARSTPRARA